MRLARLRFLKVKVKSWEATGRFLAGEEQGQVWTLQRPLRGLPWWSNGYNSVLPTQGAWIRSLVRELRSHITRCGQKN